MPDIESRLAALEMKVEALTNSQDAIIADAAKVPESLALNFRLLSRNLDAKLAVQDRKIDALASGVGELKADMGHVKRDIGAILGILGEQFKPKS